MRQNIETNEATRQKGSRGFRAFTLVEVLVIVAVVVVLLSILVPSLGFAKRRAMTAACLANARQLNLGLTGYATANNGLLFANVYTSSGYWITQLAPYDTKLDNVSILNGKVDASTTSQNLICPAATSFAYDVGNASQGWGCNATSGKVYAAHTAALCPNSFPASWSFLNNYAGSYGLNTWIYNATFPQGSAMANTIQAGTGSKSLLTTPTALAVAGISGHVSGNATAGGSISASVTGTSTPGAPGIQLPPVQSIYDNLLTTATTISSVGTIDFTNHSVLFYSGSPDLSNSIVIGNGVLLVNGNPIPPANGQTINLVVQGSISLNGSNKGGININGDIYVTGDVTTSGNPPDVQINGMLVALGSFSFNGNNTWNISGGGLPSWGGYGYVRNIMSSSTPYVTFADSIWVEGAPNPTTDAPPTNTNGDITNNTGRFYVARHGNTINAVFSDGHAENVPLANVAKLRWK